MVSGYIFWFIISRITTSQVIGSSSAVVSLGTIFSIAAGLGIPSGIQRFLGKSFSDHNEEEIKILAKASLILTSIGIAACCILILIMYNWIYKELRIDFSLIILTILFVISTSVMTLFRSIVISSLKTRVLPLVMIISATVKLGLAIVLVLISIGALGVTIGFTSFPILASVLLGIILLKVFRSSGIGNSKANLRRYSKPILAASVAAWIPSLIHTIGTYLGPLLVYGSNGASQAGIYFIAFSLVTAISAVMSALFTIGYPTLSTMEDGRKRFSWRAVKMTLIISLPLSSAFIAYSKQVMQLFGHEYVSGSYSLEILLLSMLPIAVTTAIYTLVYSYGNYTQVLAIGLASSIPRTLLYFVLVPFYDITGASISYTLGSLMGFLASAIIARKINMQIFWKDLALTLAIPSAIAFFLSYFQTNYILGISITLIASYLIFLKTKIITRMDVQDSLAIVPENIAHPLHRMTNSIYKKLNKMR